MTRTAQKIGALCVALGVLEAIPPDLEIRRTHAGRRQREDGAWSWFLSSKIQWRVERIGSPYTARELAAHGAADLVARRGEYGDYTLMVRIPTRAAPPRSA